MALRTRRRRRRSQSVGTTHRATEPAPVRLLEQPPPPMWLGRPTVSVRYWRRLTARTLNQMRQRQWRLGQRSRASASDAWLARVSAPGYTSSENLSDHPRTIRGCKPVSGSVYGIHANAKINAKAPTEPTSAWPIWIQVVIRFVIGVMSGSPASRNVCASR